MTIGFIFIKQQRQQIIYLVVQKKGIKENGKTPKLPKNA